MSTTPATSNQIQSSRRAPFFASLRARLLLLVLLALLPVLLMSLYSAREQRDAASAAAQAQALSYAQLAASKQDQLINTTRQILITLAHLPVVREMNWSSCSTLFATLLEQYKNYANIAVVDRQGNVTCSAVTVTKPVNISGQEWFQQVISSKDFAVGDFRIGAVTGKALLPLGYPVFDDAGQVIAVVSTGLDLSVIGQIIGLAQLPPESSLVVADRQGIVLFRHPDNETYMGKLASPAFLERMNASPEGTYEGQGLDGVTRLYGFGSLATVPNAVYVVVGLSRKYVIEGINRSLIQNLIGLTVVLIVTVIVAWWGSNVLFLRHMNTLVSVTRRFSSGERNVRAALTYNGSELDDLAYAFNDMAASLQQREHELELYNNELKDEVAARRRAEDALRQSYAQLEVRVQERTADLKIANEEISTFAYIVSHDLRAPLLNLKGFSSELRSSVQMLTPMLNEGLIKAPKEESKQLSTIIQEDIPEALQFIESAVTRMDHLTSAVLKLSRLGRRELVPQTVHVDPMVQTILNSLGHQIKQKNVTVTVLTLPDVNADMTSMEQIFGNLLTNAVLYLKPDRAGIIEIGGEVKPSETMYYVRDNGRGIAEEDRHKVFEPFRRAGREVTPGEGMGLAYVQTLVRRHGGRIWYTSEVGEGTTFYFTIAKNFTKDNKG